MIVVVDASAILPVLMLDPSVEALERRLLDPATNARAPHLLDIEITHVLRREVANRRATAMAAERALSDLTDLLPIERCDHRELLTRIWELRANLTAYDAAYVALAELHNAPLLTRDAKLAAAPGHRARVELI